MKILDLPGFRMAKFFHPSQVDAETQEGIRSQSQQPAEDPGPQAGLPAGGGQEKGEDESYDAPGGKFTETLIRDVHFALRVLRRSPGFTIAAVLTLALAIGANAIVFGIMDGLILRPLNVPQAETLYGTEYGEGSGFQSYLNYLDLRNHNRSFDDLAAFNFAFVGLDTGKNPSLATGFATSGNYFDVLRLRPYLGRFFHATDEHGPASAPYIVLSYAYWHTRFQDDRGVLGRVVQLDKHPFTIIGVAPSSFSGTLLFGSSDFYMPIVNQDQLSGENTLGARGNNHGIFEVFGHLKAGVSPAQAVADVNAIGANLEKTYPGEVSHKRTALSHPGLTSFGGAARAFVAGLTLFSGLILLAACANLGSMFAARAADRSREMALRLALGSSRKRILQQLLTEALLISLAGGVVGLFVSILLLRRLSLWQPFDGAPVHLPVSPDAKIYLVALLLALVSGFLFGIVPVRQVLRANPYEIVKAGYCGRIGQRMTVRDVLLVLQIAICAVLVTSSLVAVRGMARSLHGNFGFQPQNAILVNTNLAMAGYSGEQVPVMQRRMIHAMETIPGVQQVGLVDNYPPLINAAGDKVNIFKEDSTDLRPSNAAAMPYRYDISPGYFQAADTTMLAGRSFSWHEDKNGPRTVVVNREFAGKIFGSVTNAVGRYFKEQDGTRVQVVGVVENGKYLSLTENQQPAIFLPFLQSPANQTYIIVRSMRDPQQVVAAIKSQLRELDAGLPSDIKTWKNSMAVVMFPSRVATMSLGVMGVMGAILSVTGIFGMAAYSVSKRLRELGICIALGAQRREVLQAALGRPFKLLAFGSLAGLILGILASRVLAFIVYQATPRDPLVLAGVILAMLLLGLLATWIPAQRALSVDPLLLLRED